jgi:hypothetical protein
MKFLISKNYKKTTEVDRYSGMESAFRFTWNEVKIEDLFSELFLYSLEEVQEVPFLAFSLIFLFHRTMKTS